MVDDGRRLSGSASACRSHLGDFARVLTHLRDDVPLVRLQLVDGFLDGVDTELEALDRREEVGLEAREDGRQERELAVRPRRGDEELTAVLRVEPLQPPTRTSARGRRVVVVGVL